MLVSGLSTPFRRVIRVHTRVGEVDRGVDRDRGTTLVSRATCVVMVLGPPDVAQSYVGRRLVVVFTPWSLSR
jgi:hypothetical protein